MAINFSGFFFSQNTTKKDTCASHSCWTELQLHTSQETYCVKVHGEMDEMAVRTKHKYCLAAAATLTPNNTSWVCFCFLFFFNYLCLSTWIVGVMCPSHTSLNQKPLLKKKLWYLSQCNWTKVPAVVLKIDWEHLSNSFLIGFLLWWMASSAAQRLLVKHAIAVDGWRDGQFPNWNGCLCGFNTLHGLLPWIGCLFPFFFVSFSIFLFPQPKTTQSSPSPWLLSLPY